MEVKLWNGFRVTIAGGGNTKDKTVTFTQSQKRENIASGENHGAIFGKIARYFSDLKTVAFTGSYNDLAGRPSIPAAVRVKGNAESAYRTGDVNLTPANIGAAAASHSHTKSQISDFPSSLPASDVKAWAKAANKPSYNWSEIGSKPSTFPPSSHTHNECLIKSMFNGTSGVIQETIKNFGGIEIYRSGSNGGKYGLCLFNTDGESDRYGVVMYYPDELRIETVHWVDGKSSSCELCLSVNDTDTAKSPYICANGTTLQRVKKVDLGAPNSLFGQIYAANTAISTSDREVKKEISYIGDAKKYDDTYMGDEKLISFIMGLMPCIYKFIDNDSNRPHHGLLSQDIEKLLQSLGIKDHAAFIKSPRTTDVEVEEETEREIQKEDGTTEIIKEKIKKVIQKEIPGEYDYFLRYEEFIADIIRFCQILYNKNEALENTMQGWQQKTEELEGRIAGLEEIINNRA